MGGSFVFFTEIVFDPVSSILVAGVDTPPNQVVPETGA
jgi:hypothetical protein